MCCIYQRNVCLSHSAIAVAFLWELILRNLVGMVKVSVSSFATTIIVRMTKLASQTNCYLLHTEKIISDDTS